MKLVDTNNNEFRRGKVHVCQLRSLLIIIWRLSLSLLNLGTEMREKIKFWINPFNLQTQGNKKPKKKFIEKVVHNFFFKWPLNFFVIQFQSPDF